MKKTTFISIFITAHVLFIILQIHKHSKFVKLSYVQQQHKKVYDRLVQKKEKIKQHLYAQQDRTAVKKLAYEKLDMRQIRMGQIKSLDTIPPGSLRTNGVRNELSIQS